jgi:hypothetical protein
VDAYAALVRRKRPHHWLVGRPPAGMRCEADTLRALAINEAVFDTDHPQGATALINLGNVLRLWVSRRWHGPARSLLPGAETANVSGVVDAEIGGSERPRGMAPTGTVVGVRESTCPSACRGWCMVRVSAFLVDLREEVVRW